MSVQIDLETLGLSLGSLMGARAQRRRGRSNQYCDHGEGSSQTWDGRRANQDFRHVLYRQPAQTLLLSCIRSRREDLFKPRETMIDMEIRLMLHVQLRHADDMGRTS